MLTAKVAVMVSGGGTNLQALIDYARGGDFVNGKINLVISSNVEAYALKRAKNAEIPTAVVERKMFASQFDFESKIIEKLDEYEIDIIVLAGFMTILSAEFTGRYKDRIINIHPSLIPSFCGKGYYGLKVHEAALDYGVKVTGATVHYVNEIADGGKIIMQKAISIQTNDTPKTLQKRVLEKCEWKILPKATDIVCRDYLNALKEKNKEND